MEIAILIKSTPRWANGKQYPGFGPLDPQDAADFATAASKRFPSVRYWMVWGEANGGRGFMPMIPGDPTGPRNYAEVLDAVYGGLKAADPSNIVIGGMTYTAGDVRPVDFLDLLRLADGSRPRLDMWGHNPFTRRWLDIAQDPYDPKMRDFADIDTFANEIRAAFPDVRTVPEWDGPPLWLSEFTASSDRPNRAFGFYVTREMQAWRLATAYWIASGEPYVASLGWFNLLDEPVTQTN